MHRKKMLLLHKLTMRGSVVVSLVEFRPPLLLMVKVCVSKIIFPYVSPSMCASSDHLSVTLSPKPLDGIQPNLLHHSPHGKDVREQHFFWFIRHPSLCPARCLLLNHWAEFNQTCYIISPHSKGVREQHYFPVCLSGVSPSCYFLQNHWTEFNQTCDITTPHSKGVGEHPVMLLATLAARVGI